MRHARIQQAKPERSFAERIVAVIVAIAMLGGMGYATTSAALAEDTPATVETTTDQSATTANESTGGKNARTARMQIMRAILPPVPQTLNPIPTLVRMPT